MDVLLSRLIHGNLVAQPSTSLGSLIPLYAIAVERASNADLGGVPKVGSQMRAFDEEIKEGTTMNSAGAALRQAVMRLLAQEVGEGRNAEELVAAVGRVHGQLVRGLSPLIGEVGVHAIFIRSVQLTKAEFSFPDGSSASGPAEILLSQVQTSLRMQEPAATREIAIALFTTFAGLLASFIGEKLAWRLLGDIWPEAFSNRERIMGDER